MNTCPQCHAEYIPRANNQKYCAPKCARKTRGNQNESRDYKRSLGVKQNERGGIFKPTTFIGIDGESIWLGEPYKSEWSYCLLSVGEESLHHNGAPLTLNEIFDFLYGVYLNNKNDNPTGKFAYVGFYLSFDFTHWLKQLPEERARMLLTKEGVAKRTRKIHPELGPFAVEWNGWEFDLLGDKRLKLRPKQGAEGWLNICDTGPFFQTSLVNASTPNKWPAGIIDPDDYALVIEGKSHRGTGGFDSKLIEYNKAENRILAAMLGEYERGLNAMGIKLKPAQWFGPGQASSAWLKTTSCPTTKIISEKIPRECIEAAQASYYGGRFEVFQHGHIPGDTHEYDINSAYPLSMLSLPDITNGTWINEKPKGKRRHQIPTTYPCLVKGLFSGPENSHVGALPYRTPQGKILYPSSTSGWYWAHEIIAAQKAGLINSATIAEYWTFAENYQSRPLAGVADLYLTRQKVGKDTSEGKALKLVYNSAYGKTAQSVGAPKYANPFYASLITSLCRTQILDAIATHPSRTESLVMIATDGIYFREPHPYLKISNNLGDWDSSVKKNLTTFLPGIYWDDKTRERLASNQAISIKSRGISGTDLGERLAQLDDLFRAGDFPELDIPIRFTYLSLKQSLIGKNPLDKTTSRWTDAGVPQQGKLKHIRSNPSDKRDTRVKLPGDTIRFGVHPYPGRESTPYAKSFGMDLDDQNAMRDLASEDETSIASELASILYDR